MTNKKIFSLLFCLSFLNAQLLPAVGLMRSHLLAPPSNPKEISSRFQPRLELLAELSKEGFTIAPSILGVPGDRRTSKAAEAIEEGAKEDVKVIAHFDVIDGNGGRGTQIVQKGAQDTLDELKPEQVREIREKCKEDAIIDVHLMVMEPGEKFIKEYIDAGAGIVTIHWEGFNDKEVLLSRLRYIKECGALAGLAFNPDVDIHEVGRFVKKYRQDIDMLLQMSVYPGKGGQDFMKEVLENVKMLREKYDYEGLIEIDGGINKDTIVAAKEAGVDIFVAGGAFFRKDDLKKDLLEREDLMESCRIFKSALAGLISTDAVTIPRLQVDTDSSH